MRLVLAVHWATDDADLCAVADALAPLKAPGTDGYALLYAEGDPAAQKMYDNVKAQHDEDSSA